MWVIHGKELHSHPLWKLSFLIFLPNGHGMNCSDIYLTLTASLIPYSYKSPAGKVYVSVLSVLQSIFTNCISESLPSLCFQTVLILCAGDKHYIVYFQFHHLTKKRAVCVKKRNEEEENDEEIKTVRAVEMYHQNKIK